MTTLAIIVLALGILLIDGGDALAEWAADKVDRRNRDCLRRRNGM